MSNAQFSLDIEGIPNFQPEEAFQALVRKVQQRAQILAGDARDLCPVGLHAGESDVTGGNLRDSIHDYTEVHGEEIEGGAATSVGYAPFVEFGTGPVGDQEGHPLDGPLGITRRSTGWTYYKDGKFIHTKGQPAQPYMYPAMKQNEEEILHDFQSAVKEGFVK